MRLCASQRWRWAASAAAGVPGAPARWAAGPGARRAGFLARACAAGGQDRRITPTGMIAPARTTSWRAASQGCRPRRRSESRGYRLSTAPMAPHRAGGQKRWRDGVPPRNFTLTAPRARSCDGAPGAASKSGSNISLGDILQQGLMARLSVMNCASLADQFDRQAGRPPRRPGS